MRYNFQKSLGVRMDTHLIRETMLMEWEVLMMRRTRNWHHYLCGMDIKTSKNG